MENFHSIEENHVQALNEEHTGSGVVLVEVELVDIKSGFFLCVTDIGIRITKTTVRSPKPMQHTQRIFLECLRERKKTFSDTADFSECVDRIEGN